MAITCTIELFDRQKQDRAGFSCGVPALDSYLKEQASQEVKRNIAVAYVLCEQDESSTAGQQPILGYYTISAATMVTTQLPPEVAKRLPRYEALPAILIGRLAVDQRQQGRGLGARLLVNALSRCRGISAQMGAMAVVTDAKDEGAAAFYARYGFRSFVDRQLNLHLPIGEIPIWAAS